MSAPMVAHTEPSPAPTPTLTARRRPTRALSLAALVVIGLLLPFGLDGYWLSQSVFVLIVAIGALGLDVLTGRTGQISLGHAFFLAVGAYTGGVIGGHFGVTAAVWIPAAGIVAGLLGAVVGPTALRLRGLYLGIVTIALVFIGDWLFQNITWLSGGPGGEALPGVRFGSLDFTTGFHVAGLNITHNRAYYYLALLLLVLAMAFVHNFGKGRPGRAMAAVRDGEVVAAVLGVDVARTKVLAFVVSAFLAGIAGALYGSFLSFVVPTQWNLAVSVEYVVVVVVGGLATVWGPLLGALFVVGLPALLEQAGGTLPFLASGSNLNGAITPANAAEVVYGVVLVVFLIFEPRGVIGVAHRVASAVRRRRARGSASSA